MLDTTSVKWWMVGAYAVAFLALVLGLMGHARGRRSEQAGAQRKKADRDGLWWWFTISLVVAVAVFIAAIVLFVFGLNKAWVAERFASALAPLITVVTAAIGSAGAARLAIAQSAVAKKARLEDAVKEMWKRFEGAAKQLADSSHFAIRVAGVYSLVGLADDWIRHHEQSGTTEADAKKAECETIVDTLCGYLRMNTHMPKASNGRTSTQPDSQECVVNEAALGQLWVHLRLRDEQGADKPAMWANLGLVLDLHETDLSKWIAKYIDLRKAVLTDADLYSADLTRANLTKADLRRADLCATDLTGAVLDEAKLDGVKYDADTKWPSGGAFPPPTAKLMPAGGEHERVGRAQEPAPPAPPVASVGQ
uniref:Pentapeptide repeat containing protein n=1 Tax=Rhodococcus hoagii TaxID=43767 RepID=A0A1Z1UWR6_RHOHA|nr:Pentapeptide repeat containing protein [Prescottella equi]